MVVDKALKMKCLHVINNLGSGGAEKLVESLVPLMNQQDGVRVDVLLLTDVKNEFDLSLKKKGVDIAVIPLRSPRNPLNILYIRNHILRGRYDVVHAHLFPALYWTSIASLTLCTRQKPTFVLTEHSTYNRRRKFRILRLLDRMIYSNYCAVICVSNMVTQNLKMWLGNTADGRLVTVPSGIDLRYYQDAPLYSKKDINPQFDEQTKIISMVGRFSKAKDHQTLIRAMKLLPEWSHLLLIGEGPLQREHEEFVSTLNLGHRVHFLGFRRDVAQLMKASDICVLSSHWEGFGLAAVEAMAAGKPVVVSKVPGLTEVVGNAGVLFEPRDHQGLAYEIRSLLNDENRYSLVASACATRAKEFDLSRMVNQYLDCYQNCME